MAEFIGVCATHAHAGTRHASPDCPWCAAEARVAELDAALRPFVESSWKWAENNHDHWGDDACGILDADGNLCEWFAEIEVCNRDVLRAQQVLAKGDGNAIDPR